MAIAPTLIRGRVPLARTSSVYKVRPAVQARVLIVGGRPDCHPAGAHSWRRYTYQAL